MGFRNVCEPTFVLFVLLNLPQLSFAQNFETGDNSTVKGCSSHCSVQDKSLSCWNKTLHFYEKMIVSQIRHYVAVQINIDQWHLRNDVNYSPNFTTLGESAAMSFRNLLENEDLLNADTVAVVAKSLMARIAQNTGKLMAREAHFYCPLPCEYRHNLWRNIFIVSAVLNVGLALAVIPFIRAVIKADNNEALLP